VLDAFEYILNKPGADVNTWRPRVEHAQIFQPSDLERIGRLGGWFTPQYGRLLLIKFSPSHCERTADTCVRTLPPQLTCDDINVCVRTTDMKYAETRLVS
jgi:predicted amidohydrolase YtcJ